MRITILTVGKIKEPYLREAVQEYSKRLGRYCRLEILETADEKTPDQLETAAAQQVRQREGERPHCICNRRFSWPWQEYTGKI